MRNLGTILLGLAALLVIGGFIALAILDVHAPQTPIEKIIQNDRFFQAH